MHQYRVIPFQFFHLLTLRSQVQSKYFQRPRHHLSGPFHSSDVNQDICIFLQFGSKFDAAAAIDHFRGLHACCQQISCFLEVTCRRCQNIKAQGVYEEPAQTTTKDICRSVLGGSLGSSSPCNNNTKDTCRSVLGGSLRSSLACNNSTKDTCRSVLAIIIAC